MLKFIGIAAALPTYLAVHYVFDGTAQLPANIRQKHPFLKNWPPSTDPPEEDRDIIPVQGDDCYGFAGKGFWIVIEKLC